MSAEVLVDPALVDSWPTPLQLVSPSRLNTSRLSQENATHPQLINQTGVVEVEGHEVPWTMTYRSGLDSRQARIIFPGYFGVEASYDAAREAGASSGDATVTFDPPRESVDIMHPTRLLAKTGWAVVKSMGHYGIEGVHAIGHSNGGPATVRMTQHQLERRLTSEVPVLSVTLADAAGTTHHNLLELAARTAPIGLELAIRGRHFKHGQQSPKRPSSVSSAAHYAFDNPLQTVLEGVACAQTDIRPGLTWLRQHGVPTIAIGHNDDHFFPAKRMERYIGSLVDYFMIGNPPSGAGHFGPQLYPEEFIADHNHALQQLELKR